jgi:monothiol glutaredoxin
MALDAGGPLMIFDVRTDAERALASIDGAVALDDDGQRRLEATDRSARVVFMCHHGVRSRVAAEAALRKGFTDVWNLEGGIDAWSTEVDSAVARY